MTEISNSLFNEIQAQLEAVREELRASKSSDAAQLEAVRKEHCASKSSDAAQLEAVWEEMRQRMAFLQGENDALRSQVQSVASIAFISRRGEDVATVATRLNMGSIPALTEPFIPHSGAGTSGGAGPSTRFIPPANPRRNIFRNLFAEPQRQHVPNHVDIHRYFDINNQMRQVPSHVDMPIRVDINNRRFQEPKVVTIQTPYEQRETQAVTSSEAAGPQVQTHSIDPLAIIMEELRELREKVNNIPGVPRPLDMAPQTCYADTPFGRHITNVEIPRKFATPSMRLFDGTSDPVEHVAQYKQQMLAISVRPDQREDCMCRAFGTMLTGLVLTWFVNLPNDDINSFAELVNLFNQQFASSRALEKQTSDLYRVVQRRNESLRDYLHRFNKEKVSIPRCHMSTTFEAFRKGLLEDSELYQELTKYPSRSFEDVQAKALAFIRLEEDLCSRRGQIEQDGGHGKSESPRRHDYKHGKPYSRPEEQVVTYVTR
ncbi:unnamed protein product [Cuscuta epithymum]|uniref:Retrotransposon gag domain-containing protein n=1 Tax=Cuscuta epithymum TaxID=186058 RepID=A0AAV0CLE3_9ASTE|nr:unnamed protein product [Cuscuta epithymum]